MFIYIICPVRNITTEQQKEIEAYVQQQERLGHIVHYPPRDVNQEDNTGGAVICYKHRHAMHYCDVVDIFWDKNSTGSHFDFGMAFALNKKIRLISSYHDDIGVKSYEKVIRCFCEE